MLIEDILSIVMVVLFILFIILYTYTVFRFTRIGLVRKLKKRYFRAVMSVLNNTDNEEERIRQLNLDFKKMSESYSIFSSEIKNSMDILEELIFEIDTIDEKHFEKRYEIKVTKDIRNQILKIIERMREQNPFISISSKEANLLINLNQAIETGNKDFGHTILKQLSDEIEMLENNVAIQHNRNKNSYIIAAVGIVLTIYFGILSLLR